MDVPYSVIIKNKMRAWEVLISVTCWYHYNELISRKGRGDISPANISTSNQLCFNVVDQIYDVENETKSDVGFLTLENADRTSESDVEITSKQRRYYNVVSTLFQRSLNIVKTRSKPVRLFLNRFLNRLRNFILLSEQIFFTTY